MKKLAVSFAAAALTTVTTAGYSDGQKETAADAVKGSKAVTTAEQIAGAKTGALETTAEAAEVTVEADEENYDTGDASKDSARNQDGIGENRFPVVSFGTGYNDSRRPTIGVIEDAIEKAFPDFAVKRGFTSQIIIDHVKSRDNVVIDNVGEVLDRAEKNGVGNLVIQPIHLMNGLEHTDLVNEAVEYSDAFGKVAIGKPLLTTEDDFRVIMKAVTKATAQYNDGETTICFMGHGTEVKSNQVYAKIQDMLIETGYKNYYVGIVEAASSPDDALAAVEEGSYKKVVLEPLMIVAGNHANNDMVGDEEGSWKTAFEDAGYEMTCLVNELGQLEVIQRLLVEHAQVAVDSLTK